MLINQPYSLDWIALFQKRAIFFLICFDELESSLRSFQAELKNLINFKHQFQKFK